VRGSSCGRTDRGGLAGSSLSHRTPPTRAVPGVWRGRSICCADISRDLSAGAGMSADCIPPSLQRSKVGSPGVEARASTCRRDYERFRGVKPPGSRLTAARAGQYVIFGTLHGLDDQWRPCSLKPNRGELASIEARDDSERLASLFEWEKKKGHGPLRAVRRGERPLPPHWNESSGGSPRITMAFWGAQPQNDPENDRRTSGKAKKSPPPQRSR